MNGQETKDQKGGSVCSVFFPHQDSDGEALTGREKAYGQALAKLGHASNRIIALDGDTKNSTFSELFKSCLSH